MTPHDRSYILLHVAVVLFGFTAILGDLITLNALEIVWWRVLLTAASLVFFIGFRSLFLRSLAEQNLIYLLIGALVGLHWLCFYGSIKLAGPSITLICMATTSFFTALFEPIILKDSHKRSQLFTGIVIVPAMAFIASEVEPVKLTGIGVGLLSAALAAVFASLNKKFINDASPYRITFLEMLGALIFMTVIMMFYSQSTLYELPDMKDLLLLLVLALICTTLAYVLSLKALKFLTAFESNLVINLEPIYGILMAAFILKEYESLTTGFYIGSVLILGTVIIYPIMTRNERL